MPYLFQITVSNFCFLSWILSSITPRNLRNTNILPNNKDLWERVSDGKFFMFPATLGAFFEPIYAQWIRTIAKFRFVVFQ